MAVLATAALVAHPDPDVGGLIPNLPIGQVDHQSAGWYLWIPDRTRPHQYAWMRLMASQGGQGAFLVYTSTQALEDQIIARAANVWLSLAELRADSGPVATAIKTAWRDDRPRDVDGNRIGELIAQYHTIAGETLTET